MKIETYQIRKEYLHCRTDEVELVGDEKLQRII